MITEDQPLRGARSTASSRIIFYSYVLGVASMLAALYCSTVTIAGNDYQSVLRWGVGFAALSCGCFGVVVVRGSWSWRLAAIIWSMPLVYVVSETSRRGGF